jgi:hypothetical protein
MTDIIERLLKAAGEQESKANKYACIDGVNEIQRLRGVVEGGVSFLKAALNTEPKDVANDRQKQVSG